MSNLHRALDTVEVEGPAGRIVVNARDFLSEWQPKGYKLVTRTPGREESHDLSGLDKGPVETDGSNQETTSDSSQSGASEPPVAPAETPSDPASSNAQPDHPDTPPAAPAAPAVPVAAPKPAARPAMAPRRPLPQRPAAK